MKIRMLVNGHSEQTYQLEYGKYLLTEMKQQGKLIVDNETKQLAKLEFLNDQSSITVYPAIIGG